MPLRSRTVLLTVTFAFASCHARREVPAPPVTTGPAFTADEIRRTVDDLLRTTSSGIDVLQRTELRARLDAVLSGEAFAGATRRTSVKAVGLYRFGEGGVTSRSPAATATSASSPTRGRTTSGSSTPASARRSAAR